MNKLLLLTLISFTALPTLAASAPNLYECVGDGMYVRYGTTDFAGKAYIYFSFNASTSGTAYRFDEYQDSFIWRRTWPTNTNTVVTGNFSRGFINFSVQIVFPETSLDNENSIAQFSTRAESFDMGEGTLLDTVELKCEAKQVHY